MGKELALSVCFAQICFHRGPVRVEPVGEHSLALPHDWFHGVQVGTVRWKEDKLEGLLSAFNEALYDLSFVPPGIVEHDQEAAATTQELLEARDEGPLVELFAERIAEASPSQKADRVELLAREVYLGDGTNAPPAPASLAVRADDQSELVQAGYCKATFSVLC